MAEHRFESRWDAPGRCLYLQGEIDEATLPELRRALDEALQSVGDTLWVDLTGVVHLPSSALGVVATTRRDAAGRGTTVHLRSEVGTISHRILRVSGLPVFG